MVPCGPKQLAPFQGLTRGTSLVPRTPHCNARTPCPCPPNKPSTANAFLSIAQTSYTYSHPIHLPIHPIHPHPTQSILYSTSHPPPSVPSYPPSSLENSRRPVSYEPSTTSTTPPRSPIHQSCCPVVQPPLPSFQVFLLWLIHSAKRKS